jgi:hypothetical protein
MGPETFMKIIETIFDTENTSIYLKDQSLIIKMFSERIK